MISVTYTSTEGLDLKGTEVGAWLAETAAGADTSFELLANGDFTSATTFWAPGNGATLASVSGELRITSDGTDYSFAGQAITTVVGREYTVSCYARRGTCTVPVTLDVSGLELHSDSTSATTNTLLSVTFVATDSAYYVSLIMDGALLNTETAYFDTVSATIGVTDLSASNAGLHQVGTLTKTAVATGADLTGVTGWGVGNYYRRYYAPDLDMTGAITIMAWVKLASINPSSAQVIAGNRNRTTGDIGGYSLYIGTGGHVFMAATDNAGTTVQANSDPVNIDEWLFVVGTINSTGTISVYINGAIVGVITGAVIGATATPFKVGVDLVAGTIVSPFSGGIAPVKVMSTALTAAQIRTIYDREKSLFIANAPYRVVGTQYGLDYDVSALDYSESEESEQSESMSGRNIETTYNRSIGVWNLTITNLQTADLPTARNFLRATRGNAEFTFDPYGTIAAPSEPVTVITKANFKEQRSGNSDYFNISQQFRILNL